MFLASMFPPCFFNKAKAESSSARDPCLDMNHRSFRVPLEESLRIGVCFTVFEGDAENSMNLAEEILDLKIERQIKSKSSVTKST